MSIPLNSFTNDQKYWYASLVIAAVLADKEIDVSETEFLKQVLTVIQDPAQKKQLMNYIAKKEQPPITPPENLNKEQLAAIYVELILIMISDIDFADHEKEFLTTIGNLFKFEPKYIQDLLKWAEKGLSWKKKRSQLCDAPVPDQVPLKKLSADQKQWYAQTLISTIMSDGQIDREEVSFVKMAAAMIESPVERQKLINYMKNKMCPPLSAPPGIPREIILQIFMEVLMILSADEIISYKENIHLKKLADLCQMETTQFDIMMDWCNTGIKWKKSKNQLISECRLKTNKITKGQTVNEKYNSITERNVRCYICDSEEEFTTYYLKPQTHKPDRNIFGIITYSSTFEGFDYINYNIIKVSVCPKCFFASAQKEHFKKTEYTKAPTNLTNETFVKHWLDNIETRKMLFENNMGDLNTIEPDLGTVTKSYKTAIEVSNLLHKTNKDDNQKWIEISLYLNLAEIYSEYGEKEAAEDTLITAVEVSEQLFKTAHSPLLSIRCARILLIAALYREDLQAANDYMKFLQEEKMKNIENYKPDERVFLNKVYKEAKTEMENRKDLKKEKLAGFHKKIG